MFVGFYTDRQRWKVGRLGIGILENWVCGYGGCKVTRLKSLKVESLEAWVYSPQHHSDEVGILRKLAQDGPKTSAQKGSYCELLLASPHFWPKLEKREN